MPSAAAVCPLYQAGRGTATTFLDGRGPQVSAINVFDNDAATLWYHPEARVVHHQFKKPIFGEEFRTVLNTGLQIMEEYGAIKWLSDDRNNSAIPPEDADWAQNDWFPRVLEAGWQQWAIVLPENVIGQMDMQQFIENETAAGIEVQVFPDLDEALAWLENTGT
jgi:hypothetical protein